ncbi:MAG: carboxylesterase family protein, partial [Rhodospirillales bacterium]|nr:carboxylesterase family protein [Rhodospirillales bacterium]
MRAFLVACVGVLIAGCAGTLMWSPVTILNALALGPYHTETDISYGPGPRQRLDVYIPRHANGAPLVVFYYGGSWEFGKKSLYRFVGAALASNGVVVV